MNKILLILSVFLIYSCTTIRNTSGKPPKQAYVKWYSKKSLRKYSKEFSKKDWTKKDTVIVPTLDTTLFK